MCTLSRPNFAHSCAIHGWGRGWREDGERRGRVGRGRKRVCSGVSDRVLNRVGDGEMGTAGRGGATAQAPRAGQACASQGVRALLQRVTGGSSPLMELLSVSRPGARKRWECLKCGSAVVGWRDYALTHRVAHLHRLHERERRSGVCGPRLLRGLRRGAGVRPHCARQSLLPT